MEQKFSVLFYISESTRPDRLKSAVNSVLANTVRPAEMIAVVFGKLRPEIQDILATSRASIPLRTLHYLVDFGRAAALQLGVCHASCELVALQDADTVSRPDRFAKQLAYFAQNPQVAVLGGFLQLASRYTPAQPEICKVPCTPAQVKSFLKKQCPCQPSTVMFKRSILLRAGNYQSFPFSLEDYYLWIRVIGLGYQVGNLPEVLVRRDYIPTGDNIPDAYLFFKARKALYDEMRRYGLLNIFSYYYRLIICFTRELLVPKWLRGARNNQKNMGKGGKNGLCKNR